MPFFQNPFADDFEGNWVLGDRHHIPKFVVKNNTGRGRDIVAAWRNGPYDLSGTDADGAASNILKINYCLHNFKNWATISVDVSAGAASTSAVTPLEIVNALNANTLFAERFTAVVGPFSSYNNLGPTRVLIRQKKDATQFRFYIINGQAEEKLGFNARAGIAEMPTYFSRHTVANRFTYTDSQGCVIELDPGTLNVDADLIDNAVDASGVSLGYDSSTVQDDWQLLRGRSGIFNFQKITVDGSDRITQIIEYPAGAVEGDMARQIDYVYSGANTNPSQITEIPHVLVTADLVTP